ncbi:MAG: hypothetical protein ACK5LN_01350 [Propioniciclava sp.]
MIARPASRYGGLTDVPALRLNRDRFGSRAGGLRLVFIICAMFSAAQFIVPLMLRLALNGGRVWPTDEVHVLWGQVAAYPVLSIPAWLTITSGLVGLAAASWYLFTPGAAVAADAAYVSLMSVLCFGILPWATAGLDPDPTGLIRPPGTTGYLVGWHWLGTPLSLILLGVGIINSVRTRHTQTKDRP